MCLPWHCESGVSRSHSPHCPDARNDVYSELSAYRSAIRLFGDWPNLTVWRTYTHRNSESDLGACLTAIPPLGKAVVQDIKAEMKDTPYSVRRGMLINILSYTSQPMVHLFEFTENINLGCLCIRLRQCSEPTDLPQKFTPVLQTSPRSLSTSHRSDIARKVVL